MDNGKLRKKFSFNRFGSIGLEEEVWLVNETGAISPMALNVLMSAGQELGFDTEAWLNGSSALTKAGDVGLEAIRKRLYLQPELPAQQIELTIPVCSTVEEALERLISQRKYVSGLAARFGCSLGYNPAPDFSEKDLLVFPRERYLNIARTFGTKTLHGYIAALHVHIGLSSHDEAIMVYNHVRRNIMEDFSFAFTPRRLEHYIALSGADNFMPPEIKNWADYESRLQKIGAKDDPTRCWWILRLNPHGTIELRLPDVTPSPDKVKKVIDFFLERVIDAF